MIDIIESYIIFKNPQIGQPSKRTKEHYYRRRINCEIDGNREEYKFTPDEIPFEATEEDMINAIKEKRSKEG